MTNNKKQFLLLLFSIFIGVGIIEHRIHQNAIPIPSNKYTDYLTNQEKSIWQKFGKIGITYDELLKRCTTFKNNCDKQPIKQTVQPKLKKIIYAILEKLQIDPRQISLVPYYGGSAAGYAGNTLHLNEQQFLKLEPLAQQFAVGHEMQHMKYQDDIAIPVLQGWIQELKLPSSDVKSLFHEFERFTEERADIQTALISEEFAQGYIVYFNNLLKSKGNNAGISHPKSSDRLKVAQNIYQSYQGISA